MLICVMFLREYAPNGVWSNRSGAPHRNHLGSTLGPGSGPVCSGSWLAGWLAGRPELLAAWLTGWLNGWLAGCLGSPGQLGFGTIFFLLSGVGFICFSGVCSLLGDMGSGATEWGSTPDTLRVHFGPRIWAWLLRVLAGWLIGWPAGPAGAAGWVADWLAEWLAGCLLGLSWTVRLWDRLFVFPGWSFSFYANRKDN